MRDFKIVSLDKISNKMKGLIKNKLDSNFEIVFCENEKEIEEHLPSADVLITFTKGIPTEWLEKAASCRFIQKLGAGVNNIDIETANARGIPVSNTKGVNARSVAEHAVLLMMSLYKQIVVAHNEIVQNGKWLKTELRDNSYELTRKKVGLVGLGNIGKEVAKLLKGFECDIAYYDVIRLSPIEESMLQVKYMELDDLLSKSDVISLHVPLNKSTSHLINKQKFELMKDTAILVNTCRGGIIDEEALYNCLLEKQILGAGIDVFEKEPIDRCNPLISLENVILTPHIGGGTVEAMNAVIEIASNSINHYLLYETFYDSSDIVNLKSLSQKNVVTNV